MATAKQILIKAADLLDKYGVSNGHFMQDNNQSMCVHGALNIGEAMLDNEVYQKPKDVPFEIASGFTSGRPEMVEAVNAVAKVAKIGTWYHSSSEPWIAGWSNRLVHEGSEAEVIYYLRAAAETV